MNLLGFLRESSSWYTISHRLASRIPQSHQVQVPLTHPSCSYRIGRTSSFSSSTFLFNSSFFKNPASEPNTKDSRDSELHSFSERLLRVRVRIYLLNYETPSFNPPSIQFTPICGPNSLSLSRTLPLSLSLTSSTFTKLNLTLIQSLFFTHPRPLSLYSFLFVVSSGFIQTLLVVEQLPFLS